MSVKPTIPSMIKVLSSARYTRYLSWAQGSHPRAWELYLANLDLSGSFHRDLHWLEVGARNHLDRLLREHLGEKWPKNQRLLPPHAIFHVKEAREKLSRRSTIDDLVASLSFGFWSGLFVRKAERLWRAAIHHGFPTGTKRRDLHRELDRSRALRNRIAHYEPILHLNLVGLHQSQRRVTAMIDPALTQELDRGATPSLLETYHPLFPPQWPPDDEPGS